MPLHKVAIALAPPLFGLSHTKKSSFYRSTIAEYEDSNSRSQCYTVVKHIFSLSEILFQDVYPKQKLPIFQQNCHKFELDEINQVLSHFFTLLFMILGNCEPKKF